MARNEEFPDGSHSEPGGCPGPEKDCRVLLMVQDGTTLERWRAFGRWSVPAEVIVQARERWGLTRPGSVLFLRISALPGQEGGNGSIAVFWDVPVTRPMPAWHLIGLEEGRTYTMLLGLLGPGNVFSTVAGPMVFHAPSVRARRHVPTSEEEEPAESRSARRGSPTSESDRRRVR